MKIMEAFKISELCPSGNPQPLLWNLDEMDSRYREDLLEYEDALQIVTEEKKNRSFPAKAFLPLLIAALCAADLWGYNWHQHRQNIETVAATDNTGNDTSTSSNENTATHQVELKIAHTGNEKPPTITTPTDYLPHHKKRTFTRVIKVPRDYPTISAAITAASPLDLIQIEPGTYSEALVIDKPILLEGSTRKETIIELPSNQASLVTITHNAAGSHFSELNLKHLGYDHLSKERFAGITIQAKDITIRSCNIDYAAGHGIAIIGGASATITQCKINQSGWDGISAYGENSYASVTKTLCQNNLQHGIGFWKGGSGRITNSRMIKNSLCGIVAMSNGTKTSIISNTCYKNRDAGILISDAVTAELHANRCEENLLSGIVARGSGTTVSLTNNITLGNRESGILTHLGVKITQFAKNRSKGNYSRQIWRNAVLKK